MTVCAAAYRATVACAAAYWATCAIAADRLRLDTGPQNLFSLAPIKTWALRFIPKRER